MRARVWLVYVGGTALLAAACLLAGIDAAGLTGASAGAAVLAGTVLHRPRTRRPWFVLATGAMLTAIATLPAAGAVRVAAYLVLAVGIGSFVRARGGTGDRPSLTDAAIVVAGAVAASWVFVMSPALDAPLGASARAVTLGAAIGGLLVLWALVRLAAGSGDRGPAFVLLAAGMGVLMAGDLVHSLLLVHTGDGPEGLVDAATAGSAILLGAAALHPAMGRVTEPAPDRPPLLTRRGLVVLAGISLVAPCVLAVRLALGLDPHAGVLTAGSTIAFVLVTYRMTGILRRHEAALGRESALRVAGQELVRAHGREAIAEAAVRAARLLAAGDQQARMYLLDWRAGEMRVAAATDGDTSRVAVEALDIADRGLLRDGRAVVLGAAVGGLPAGTGVAPVHVRGGLGGLLVVAPRAAGRRRVPLESLGALAAQVALALEGAALTDDLVRRQAAAHLSSLVQHSSDVIGIVSLEGEIRYASPSVERVLGHGAEELAGRVLADAVHPEDAEVVPAFLRGVASRPPGTPSATELRLGHADGSWRVMEILATNLLDDPTVAGIVLNARDVSDRKAFEAQLAHQAFHDTLTGLPNRALFRDRVTQALGRRRRTGTEVAVLFFDIDDFKTVNDSLGHAAGDALLREIAARLSGAIRATDTPARLGGDEFAVMVDGAADDREVMKVAERMLGILGAATTIDGREISPRASVGIAFAGDAAEDADELLRNADAAMYVAKAQGKSRYEVFRPEMHQLALQRLELQADLQRAVDAGEFSLRYQPIVDLATGRPAGVEALVRWEHPERGLILPAEFIPLAEDTGLIVPLGRSILRDACRQAAVFQAAGNPNLTVSVNVSARQLQRVEFVDEVREALALSRIPPHTLVLELTESVMVEDTDLAVRRLHALREIGVRIAVDDFGTGHSSLNYLRRFPIDILKIDRSFVRGAHEDAEVLALTRTILDLAAGLGLRPVAEGVEVAEELALLRGLGCGHGQGFLFARPLPADEVLALLQGSPARAAAT